MVRDRTSISLIRLAATSARTSPRTSEILDELRMLRHEGKVSFSDSMVDDLKTVVREGDGIEYENRYEPSAGTCYIAFRADQIHVVDTMTVQGGGSPLSWA
jgi:hypothetical protein